MAVFGVPVAHEDDAERAVRAALAVREHLERRNRDRRGILLPPVHAGIRSGEVMVAPSSEAAGFAVVGDTVNTASRLCGLARAGEILVDEPTRALTARAVRYAPRRLLRAKGKAEPLETYLALALAPATYGPAGTTFIDREEILGRLGRSWNGSNRRIGPRWSSSPASRGSARAGSRWSSGTRSATDAVRRPLLAVRGSAPAGARSRRSSRPRSGWSRPAPRPEATIEQAARRIGGNAEARALATDLSVLSARRLVPARRGRGRTEISSGRRGGPGVGCGRSACGRRVRRPAVGRRDHRHDVPGGGGLPLARQARAARALP